MSIATITKKFVKGSNNFSFNVCKDKRWMKLNLQNTKSRIEILSHMINLS